MLLSINRAGLIGVFGGRSMLHSHDPNHSTLFAGGHDELLNLLATGNDCPAKLLGAHLSPNIVLEESSLKSTCKSGALLSKWITRPIMMAMPTTTITTGKMKGRYPQTGRGAVRINLRI